MLIIYLINDIYLKCLLLWVKVNNSKIILISAGKIEVISVTSLK